MWCWGGNRTVSPWSNSTASSVWRSHTRKASFTRTVNVTVFDLFNVMCKQHHKTALSPFLNGAKKPKNGDVYGTCKQGLSAININSTLLDIRVFVQQMWLTLNYSYWWLGESH